jgi:ribonuclease P protein component
LLPWLDKQGDGSGVKLTQPLRLNYEFSRVYNKGRFLAGRHVVLHYLRRPGRPNRLGVTASRKIRGSIRRNRIKRLLRESYRLIENQLISGYDLILVGRETPDQPDYRTVSQEVGRLLQKAGVNRLEKQVDPAAQNPDAVKAEG